MATKAQHARNQGNAKLSTGPRSTQGKKASKMNAVCHGLRCTDPLLPGQNPKHWESFQLAIIQDLQPEGALETTLVSRLTLLLWRTNKITSYEAALASAKLAKMAEPSEQELKQQKKLEQELSDEEPRFRLLQAEVALLQLFDVNDLSTPITHDQAYLCFEAVAKSLEIDDFDPHSIDFLGVFGVGNLMKEDGPDPYDVVSWRIEHIHTAAEYLSKQAGRSFEEGMEKLRKEVVEAFKHCKQEIARLKRELLSFNHQNEIRLQQQIALHSMPSPEQVELICRYEAHLQRQLKSTYEQLQSIQSSRKNGLATPAVAVGIAVTTNQMTHGAHDVLIHQNSYEPTFKRPIREVIPIEQQPIGS